MFKLNVKKVNDDPDITFNHIMDSESIIINYIFRKYDSETNLYNDYMCRAVSINIDQYIDDLEYGISYLTESSFRDDMIKFNNDYLGIYLSTDGIKWLVPYAPPSFEYYRNGIGEITIEIYYYHNSKMYNTLNKNMKYVNSGQRGMKELSDLYKLYFRDIPFKDPHSLK